MRRWDGTGCDDEGKVKGGRQSDGGSEVDENWWRE